ncbi:DddA-like double-stranded DNA deaminase toxin [Saccharopolyspora sp. 5N708]|uniref:DddA-like double-stranded DNA deaminase toxin n=1 Tax=Saccharopolyspora sp. 5N708 TaxID=3457424 RepID=UPI003FD2817D
MSALSDLDQLLANIVDKLTTARTTLTTAQDALDASERFLAVLHGTNDLEAQGILFTHQQKSDQLFEQRQLVDECRHFIERYRLQLAISQAEKTSPSVPHPSTTPSTTADPAVNPRWANAARQRLPKWKMGSATKGVFLDSDGHEVEIVSGRDEQRDDVTARAALVLLNSSKFPRHPLSAQAGPEVAKHVEVKAAQRMREQGIPYGVIAINNFVCEEEYGCRSAIPAILPRGFTLAVWEPDADQPIIFEGEA